jgi:hypothetical protein
MKKYGFAVLGLLLSGGVAIAAGTLYQEFVRRENIRLTQEQGDAINFLRLMKFDVNRIEEIEILESGSFVIRDRDDVVCFGDVAVRMLRCKNKIGLSTVTLDGDAD